MKKIYVLIVAVLYYFSAVSQQIPLSNVVNLDLPKGAQKLNKNQPSLYVKKNFKTSALPTNVNNVYVLDGLLISFWDVTLAKDDKRSLQAVKSEALEVLKLNKNLIVKDASIKTINNNQFFILNYKDNDINYYRFYTGNRGGQSLNGVIQYNDPGEEKATDVLMTILKSIKFKK